MAGPEQYVILRGKTTDSQKSLDKCRLLQKWCERDARQKKSEDKIYTLKSVALLVQQQQQQEKQKTSDNQLHPISKTDEKGKKSTKKMEGKKAEMKVPELLCNGLD